jgi:hypothetical protein
VQETVVSARQLELTAKTVLMRVACMYSEQPFLAQSLREILVPFRIGRLASPM